MGYYIIKIVTDFVLIPIKKPLKTQGLRAYSEISLISLKVRMLLGRLGKSKNQSFNCIFWLPLRLQHPVL